MKHSDLGFCQRGSCPLCVHNMQIKESVNQLHDCITNSLPLRCYETAWEEDEEKVQVANMSLAAAAVEINPDWAVAAVLYQG